MCSGGDHGKAREPTQLVQPHRQVTSLDVSADTEELGQRRWLWNAFRKREDKTLLLSVKVWVEEESR